MIHELKRIRWRGSAMPPPGDDDGDDEEPSQAANLAALAVVVLLMVVGWWIANALYKHSQIGDCLLSGRTNCIVTPGS